MTQEEPGLFQVSFNEQGKKFIRKFAAISYTMMVLVFFESIISIYWNIDMLLTRMSDVTNYPQFADTFYDRAYPYVSIVFSLLALASNFFYLRFPHVLLRSIEINDEPGANQAFHMLFKGAVIFLIWLLLINILLIWGILIR